MKKGISLNIFNSLGYARWEDNKYKKLKEHGFSCVDFEMANTDTLLYTYDEKQATELLLNEKQLAENSGIEFYQVHGPWRYPVKDSTEEERAERMEKMKKPIRYTSILGAKYWVVHPLMPFGVDELGANKKEKARKINIEFFRELLKTAKEYGVVICLENMPFLSFPLSKPADIYSIVKEINDANFKMCFDTGHAFVFDDLNIYDEIKKCVDEIKVFHIHDTKCNLDLHMFPRFGNINWDDFSKALTEIGFDGCFSLETGVPGKFSDNLFEETAKLLSKIADEIINSGR